MKMPEKAVKRGYGLGFTCKSIAELGGCGFDRNMAIEARIAGAIDLAHSAFPEQRKDLVRTEAVTCGKRHALFELEFTPSERGIATRAQFDGSSALGVASGIRRLVVGAKTEPAVGLRDAPTSCGPLG
jgi:hypothetical protein